MFTLKKRRDLSLEKFAETFLGDILAEWR